MKSLPSELRLAIAILLNAAVFAGAWRFVRRRVNGDAFDRAADALLLTFLVQYASVALPGLVGVLSAISMTTVALAISAALWFAPAVPPGDSVISAQPIPDRRVPVGCLLFALGYLAGLAHHQRVLPVMSNDALTYHFPAAVQWLREGRLSLYEAWYFNPANTYSPLAGSTFIAWHIAPLGNDVIARFVQFPAVALIFFALIRLARGLGIRTGVAAVIALGLILSKPVIRQAIIEKDDLYLAAFFAAAIAGCVRERLRDSLGPWRVGAAVGLMLATKYTALLAVPALLLLVDAPFRAGWRLRRYATALALILIIASPWYVRNVVLTGNPLYPIEVKVFGQTLFAGQFSTARSTQLSSLTSVWDVLIRRDQSLPLAPVIVLTIALIAAWAAHFRRVVRDPPTRACLVGPPLLIGIFVLTSPYSEVRFIFPAYVLLFGAAVIAIGAWLKPPGAQLLAAGILLIACVSTGLAVVRVAQLAPVGALVGLGGLIAMELYGRISPDARPATVRYAGLAAGLLFALAVYVYWNGYLKALRLDTGDALKQQYAEAGVWKFVNTQLPENEPLAYADTFLTHPMSGFEHERRLIYVPSRARVTRMHDLPRLSQTPIRGEDIVPAAAAALAHDTDAGAWVDRLFASRATHIVVFHPRPPSNSRELIIIANHAERFERRFGDDIGVVFRLRR